MNASLTRSALAACAAGAFALPCSAGVTTYQFDLISAPLGIFGLEFTSDYIVDSNEIIGGEIVAARMHLNFNTSNPAGSMADAANLQIQFQPPVQGVPIWTVTGADLGWSGAGTFIADPTTTILNLPILDLPPDSFSLWFVRLSTTTGGALGGQLTGSYIEVEVMTIPAPAGWMGFAFAAFGPRRRRR